MSRSSRWTTSGPIGLITDTMVFVILGSLAIALIFSTVLFGFGLEIANFHMPVAFILSVGLTYAWYRWRKVKHLWNILVPGIVLALVVALACYFISGIFFDFSYDGQNYHQDAILRLAEGWNPIHQPIVEGYSYMLKHYPKGPWYLATSIYMLSGSIEHSKMFGILLPFCTLLIAFQFFQRIRIHWLISIILASLLSYTPTVITESFSFYVDGILISLLTLLLLLIIDFFLTGRTERLILMTLTGIVLVNVKSTGAVYCGMFLSIALLYLYCTQEDRGGVKKLHAFLRHSAAIFVVGILIAGFNPYITNTICCGHPLYPFNKTNPAIEQAPAEFIAENRVKKLTYSLFSESEPSKKVMPTLKLPFVVRKNEIEALGTTSLRYGGFGPLFSAVLSLLPVAGYLLWKRSRKKCLICLGLSGGIILSVLVVSEAWYSRFVPQLWLIPMSWIAVLFLVRARTGKVIAGFMLCLLAINQLFFSVVNWKHWRTTQERFISQVSKLKEASSHSIVEVKAEWRPQKYRLEEMGLRFSWVEKLSCTDPQRLVGTDGTTWICVL